MQTHRIDRRQPLTPTANNFKANKAETASATQTFTTTGPDKFHKNQCSAAEITPSVQNQNHIPEHWLEHHRTEPSVALFYHFISCIWSREHICIKTRISLPLPPPGQWPTTYHTASAMAHYLRRSAHIHPTFLFRCFQIAPSDRYLLKLSRKTAIIYIESDQ